MIDGLDSVGLGQVRMEFGSFGFWGTRGINWLGCAFQLANLRIKIVLYEERLESEEFTFTFTFTVLRIVNSSVVSWKAELQGGSV